MHVGSDLLRQTQVPAATVVVQLEELRALSTSVAKQFGYVPYNIEEAWRHLEGL